MKVPERNRAERRFGRGSRGASLVEMLLSVSILALTTSAVLAMSMSANRAVDRRSSEFSMTSSGRAALDEILRELRAAQEITPTRTIGGTPFTTSATQIVFWAPRHNNNGLLADAPDLNADLVAFRYNPNNDPRLSTITESTDVAAASTRPERTNAVIARRLSPGGFHPVGMQFTYRVREQQLIRSSTSSLTLRTVAGSTPQVYIGSSSTPITPSSTSQTTGVFGPCTVVHLPSPITATPVTVQILYTVNPTSNPNGLKHVNGVDVRLVMKDEGGLKTRFVHLSGNAQLRNQRS